MARILVVLPTYNRSNVLRLAVQSVLEQQVQDWQLLVVGDGCTDDTAQVMAQLSDQRVHFIGLPNNSGNMAEPINFAVDEGLTRWPETQYIALISHDDLWLPDHLSGLLAVLNTKVTFALAPYYECLPGGMVMQRHSGQTCYKVWLKPVTMSSWMVCALLWQKVGRWRTPKELIDIPSANWRFRAWQQGARFKFAELPSVIVINSVVTQGSYRYRHDAEQRQWAAKLASPELRHMLQEAVAASAQQDIAAMPENTTSLLRRLTKSVRYRFLHLLSRLMQRIAPFVGISPSSVELWMQGNRRGSFVERLMRQRGLREP